MRRPAWLGLIALATVAASAADDTDAPPPAFAPFEHLVGAWKGQAVPAKNRLKGWPERHLWAWRFDKGKPVGMAVEITGSKILAKAQLAHDAEAKLYRLEGTDPEGKEVRFAGPLDEGTGLLRLDRQGIPAEEAQERIDLALNQNKIRYTMRLFRKEPDAPQAALQIDANVGKEGESFAAGGAASDLPKCIVTGGAGALAVAFEGKSYPICCSGCRDEFLENPEKYVKKYLARQQKGEAPPAKEAAAPEASAKASAAEKGMKADAAKTKPPTAEARPESKSSAPKAKTYPKANSLLSLAQALEKAGKTDAALAQYRAVVKDHAGTMAAKTAAARVKALEKK